ncbi:MAG: hypothetical protein A3F92_00990 [Candidatus Rokubacteria bacterium RIFCSPLOWO2_12_FULL_71_22]|nr:MAG: hypothetical protein A3F92_00990 [Candidatus Rokubacteria bacterium RIFCSPLOWO2_12_FULL_71_22]
MEDACIEDARCWMRCGQPTFQRFDAMALARRWCERGIMPDCVRQYAVHEGSSESYKMTLTMSLVGT